jgi:hypothetical protein
VSANGFALSPTLTLTRTHLHALACLFVPRFAQRRLRHLIGLVGRNLTPLVDQVRIWPVHAVSKTHVCPECVCQPLWVGGPPHPQKSVWPASVLEDRGVHLCHSRERCLSRQSYSLMEPVCLLPMRGVHHPRCGLWHIAFPASFFCDSARQSHTDPFCTCHLATPHSSLPWALPSLTPTSHTRRGSRGRFTHTLRCHLHPTSHHFTRPRQSTTQS